VVEYFPVTRTNFYRLNPFVFVEVRRHYDVLVRHRATRRDMERLRNLNHNVRLADVPAIGECKRGGRIFGTTFGCTVVSPGRQRVDLRLGEGAVVPEGPVRRIGIPRRHFLLEDRGANRFRPRARLLVAHERHRTDVARMMAALTAFLLDRFDILVERYRRRSLKSKHAGKGNQTCSSRDVHHLNIVPRPTNRKGFGSLALTFSVETQNPSLPYSWVGHCILKVPRSARRVTVK
jgi:hypothetical protein